MSPVQSRNIYLTLITFLFSYAYETRITQHDFNPESAWTISVLTPALAALDPPPYGTSTPLTANSHPQYFSPSELISTLVPCYRRSLAFPLYRSFILAETCRMDVSNLLLKSRRMVIRCFLEMKRILDHHEIYYVYSKIWVDDFCVWLQTLARFVALLLGRIFDLIPLVFFSDDTLKELGRCLKSLTMEKRMVGWDLDGLEAAANQVQCDHDSGGRYLAP